MKKNFLLVACICLYLAGNLAANAITASSGVQQLKRKLEELEDIEVEDMRQNRRIVFQGDILLTKSEAQKFIEEIDKKNSESDRLKRQAQRRDPTDKNLWKDGVKYVLDPNSSKKTRDGFILAAKAWEENTCINFEEIAMKDVVPNVTDYLFVTDKDDGDGCLSHVGKLGGYQPLILGPGCETFAHAAHEVGHALGLYHTQSRHDRDKYIRVEWNNIPNGLKDEFVKLTKKQNMNYGMPYDYGSIMHYGSSIKNPSMTPSDVNYKTTMGSPMISFIDLSMINKHYGCKAMCKRKTSASCKNGGFPHPRDCKKCICPGGYGGPLCDELPKDCQQGTEVVASKEWNTLQTFVYNRRNDGSYATCTYWIKSPSGKIEVQFERITSANPTVGCAKAGVEVKANSDHKLTGYRYCVEPEPDTILRSSSNLVPIILYTKEFTWTVVELKYRYVD